MSYDDPAEAHILPKKHQWCVKMSHGFDFDSKPTRVGHHFELNATATGPKHTFVAHPGDNDDALNGRDNKPMKIRIRFCAYFECLPKCAKCPSSCKGMRITYDLRQHLKQDGIDQMRQEYVDHRTIDVTIDVPSRSDFIPATDTFYTTRDADYAYMLGKKLPGFRRAWAEKCQEILRRLSGDQSREVSETDLIVNSGYRNPEHNDHVYGSPEDANTDSWHQYGIALDVRNIDLDGDDKVIREKDGPLMEDAALEAGAGYVDWTRYNTITHADWREKK